VQTNISPEPARSTDLTSVTRTLAFFGGGDRIEDWLDKVGVSLDTFCTELSGGWLFNYVQALQLAGVRVVMCFASARTDVIERFVHEPTGAPVYLFPSPWAHRKARAAQQRFELTSPVVSSVSSYLATPVVAVARELQRQGCDAILCQEYESPRFDECVLVGRLLRLPVFGTYQGAQRPVSWIESRLRQLSIGRSSGLVIAAETEIQRVRDTYRIPRKKIAHIPNPMDVTRWRPMDRREARRQLGIALDARVVVWHGHTQMRRKGLDVLLDAWELVRKERQDLLLLLVGTGRNTGELRRRADQDPSIRWIDRFVLDREELWRYLSAADVYTLPSRHEGFAVAPIEAMACGLPVVATDASGVPDLLGSGDEGGGVIVPREAPAALASALLRLLGDPRWAHELGARARRRAEQRFSLEVVGGSLRDFMFPSASSAEGR
jgi:starch synthase